MCVSEKSISWMGNPRGTFNLKSAYSIAMGTNSNMVPFNVGQIWKLKTLPRIKTFLWICAYNSIGVKVCLAMRGVVDEDLCPICQRDLESIMHALSDYPRVKEVWTQLGVMVIDRAFQTSNLQEWLNMNRKVNKSYTQGKPPCRTIFPFAMWNIWKSKNMYVFDRKNQNPKLSIETGNQALEFMCCVSSPRNPICNIVRSIRWERPTVGWKKLNTDGSFMGNLGQAGCGGIVKDEHGEWVASFAKHIGATNSFAIELWGLRDGLMLCCNLNVPCLIVELDAKVVVDVFKNSNYVNNVISPILDDCKQLVSCFQQIQINHCYHQANRCADLLARMGAEQELDFVNFLSMPVDMFNAFENDMNGLFVNRMCPELDVTLQFF